MKELICRCTTLVAILLLTQSACKTSRKVAGPQPGGQSGGTEGVIGPNGKVNLPVPADLRNFTPPVTARTSHKSQVKAVSGLSLTANDRPVSTKGIEEILAKCFTQDSQFIAEGWYFYAELVSAGQTVKGYNSREVNKCNEMQLELKTLEKNTTYKVVASFFWQSTDRKTTIVWYEGETKEFTPSDKNIALKLEKLRVDQKVDVDVEKGEKERCLYQKYLWNGQRCLDGFNAISFSHSDLSDYAESSEVATSRKRKCLQMGSGGFAVQWDCNYKSPQLIRTKLHGAQKLNKDLPPKEYGWFSMQFNAGKFCLQVQPDPANGAPYLIQMECDSEIPRADQLFTLIETQANDRGGRNSFRIMNQADGTARCMSVPPESGDLTGVAPLRNGAPVRLTPCNDTNPNTRMSQFTRFVTKDD